MSPISRPYSFVAPLAIAFGLALATPAAAQQEPEPVLDQVQEMLSSPGFTLGFLLQAVLDPGIDDDPARVRVGTARIRMYGALDGGFSYRLQTNHVPASSLLDAQVSWSPGPELMISAGRFKTPFSREFLEYAGSIDFVNRSRVVTALAPNRQVGLQLGGRLTDIVGWTAGGFTGATNATTDESLLGVLRLEGSGIEVGEGTLAVAAQIAGGREDAVGARVFGPAFAGDGMLYGIDGRYEGGALMLSGEYIRGEWDPEGPVADVDADGLFLTAGWMLDEGRQALVRWDRYRAPGQEADDVVVLGFNAWPTGAAEIQVNWLIPLKDSAELHRLLVNFQIGIN